MGSSPANGLGSSELLFRCRACNRTSELLGWVKDVFQHCAPTWDRESLLRELNVVSKIFRVSEDTKGRQLFWKSEELMENLKGGLAETTTSRVILTFFQELDMDSPKNSEAGNSSRLVPPQEACNRITQVVQEAVQKMELVADEKMRMLKKARIALEACDSELEEKAKEVAELKLERQQKKKQIDELHSIVRLKQVEADMFQLKADEARREADRLQMIALSKLGKSEDDYASRYLKNVLVRLRPRSNTFSRRLNFKIRVRVHRRVMAMAQGNPHKHSCLNYKRSLRVYNNSLELPLKPDERL